MGGDKAHASLLLTLKMINAEIVERGTLIIPHITLKLNNQDVITNPELKQELLSVLHEFEKACYFRQEDYTP
jgi:chromate reductase